MIEIIKTGKTKFRGHCIDCGCKFTYEHEDVCRNYLRGANEVACPSCSHACRHFGESGTYWFLQHLVPPTGE